MLAGIHIAVRRGGTAKAASAAALAAAALRGVAALPATGVLWVGVAARHIAVGNGGKGTAFLGHTVNGLAILRPGPLVSGAAACQGTLHG